ncbi:MAG: hypothetical protein ACOC2H_05015 [Spirochaetota bacterium]
MRQHYSKAIEERLECIRNGCQTKDTSNKRRISRLIFILDIILIVAIFFYFYNTRDNTAVSSASVKKNGIEYRITCTENDNAYIFGAFVAGKTGAESIQFNGYIADLVIYYKETVLLHETIGGKEDIVSVSADMVENYFLTVPAARLHSALEESSMPNEKRPDGLYALLFGDGLNLTAKLTFNTTDRITVDTQFTLREE